MKTNKYININIKYITLIFIIMFSTLSFSAIVTKNIAASGVVTISYDDQEQVPRTYTIIGEGKIDKNQLRYTISASSAGRNIIKITSDKITLPENASSMFSGNFEIYFPDNFNVENVTNMDSMFYQAMPHNISKWNVGNVVNMRQTFRQAVLNEDLSSWNTEKVATMEGLFFSTKLQKNPNIDNWNTNSVNNMYEMFRETKAENLTILISPTWNTNKVTNFGSFNSGSNIFVNATNFDFTNATNLVSMYSSNSFQGTATLDTSNWNVSKVSEISNFLYYADTPNISYILKNLDFADNARLGQFFSIKEANSLHIENITFKPTQNVRGLFYSYGGGKLLNYKIEIVNQKFNFSTDNSDTYTMQKPYNNLDLKDIVGTKSLEIDANIDYGKTFKIDLSTTADIPFVFRLYDDYEIKILGKNLKKSKIEYLSKSNRDRAKVYKEGEPDNFVITNPGYQDLLELEDDAVYILKNYTPTINHFSVDIGTPITILFLKQHIVDFDKYPSGTTYNIQGENANTYGDKRGTLYITYPGTNIPISVPFTFHVMSNAEKYIPELQKITVKVGAELTRDIATTHIKNFETFPKGTTVFYGNIPNTTAPGLKTGTIGINFPNGETVRDIRISLQVATYAESFIPQVQPITVDNGVTLTEQEAIKQIVNYNEFPSGTSVYYENKSSINTSESGEKNVTIKVVYPDFSEDTVQSTINVRTSATNYILNVKDITVKYKESVDDSYAETQVLNKQKFPPGTQYKYASSVDTSIPGRRPVTVIVILPDKSELRKDANVIVDNYASGYSLTPVNIRKYRNYSLNIADAKSQIKEAESLPNGTTFRYTGNTSLSELGNKNLTVQVTYPDRSIAEVEVHVNVIDASQYFDVEVKEISVDIDTNLDNEYAKSHITNLNSLPSDIEVRYSQKPFTNSYGRKIGIIKITFPDRTEKEVSIYVNVYSMADKNTPLPASITVNKNQRLTNDDAKRQITNSTGLPTSTSYRYKTDVNTNTIGDVSAIVVVEYPDGSNEEIPVTIKVLGDASIYTPTAKEISINLNESLTEEHAKSQIINKEQLPGDTKYSYEESIDTKLPGPKVVKIKVEYPDKSYDIVTSKVNVGSYSSTYTPEVQEITLPYGLSLNHQYAERHITNKGSLPDDTRFEYVNVYGITSKLGKNDVNIKVIYPDNSEDIIPSKINIVDNKTYYNPIARKIYVGKYVYLSNKYAESQIENANELPAGTIYYYSSSATTSTIGEKSVIIKVVYPDRSSEEVNSSVIVDKYSDIITLQTRDITVAQNAKVTDDFARNHIIFTTSYNNYYYYYYYGVGYYIRGIKYEDASIIDTSVTGTIPVKIIVTFIDGSTKEYNTNVVVSNSTDSYVPYTREINVKLNDTLDGEKAKSQIINSNTFPDGTKYEYKGGVSTDTSGRKPVEIIITFPDLSTKTVSTYIRVGIESEFYNPIAKIIKVPINTVLTEHYAKSQIANSYEFPAGTTYRYETYYSTSIKRTMDVKVRVTFEDSSFKIIPTKIVVDSYKNIYDPVGKEITVEKGTRLTNELAKSQIDNIDNLPNDAEYSYINFVNTNSVGRKTANIKVKYPDNTYDEISTTVLVKNSSISKPDPIAKKIVVNKGTVLTNQHAKSQISNSSSMPVNTTYRYKDTINTDTTGTQNGIVVVVFEDLTEKEVPVEVEVIDKQPDNVIYTAVGQELTVNKGTTLTSEHAKLQIKNASSLPINTNYSYINTIDTSVASRKQVQILVTYPDTTTDTVTAILNIVENTGNIPIGQNITVPINTVLNSNYAKRHITNSRQFPASTIYTYRDDVDTTTPGIKSTAVIMNTGTITHEVPVNIIVTGYNASYTPEVRDITVDLNTNLDETYAKRHIANADTFPAKTMYYYATLINTTTPGIKQSMVIILFPDNTLMKVNVNVIVKGYAESFEPIAKNIEVDLNTKLTSEHAKSHITNNNTFPDNTTYIYSGNVDTTTPGEKQTEIIVLYPDNTTDRVKSKVIVKNYSSGYTLQGKDITVRLNTALNDDNAKSQILNTELLPQNTVYKYKTAIDTTTKGTKNGIVVVTFPDSSEKEVSVKIKVISYNDEYEPDTTKVSVDKNTVIDDVIGDIITNKDTLPKGTTITINNKGDIDTSKPGDKNVDITVTYPDKSVDTAIGVVHVKYDNEKYTPKGKAITVPINTTLTSEHAKSQILDTHLLPQHTTYIYNNAIDTATPGLKQAVIYVVYPDASIDVVTTEIVISGHNLIAKGIEVEKGTTLTSEHAKSQIANISILPSTAKISYENHIDVSTVGRKDAVVVVTYADGTQNKVGTYIDVVDKAMKYRPIGKSITVEQGTTLTNDHAKQGIKNVDELPADTTYAFKNDIDTRIPGNRVAEILVKYNDGSVDEVITTINITPMSSKYVLEGKTIEVDLNTLLTSDHAKSQIKDNHLLPTNTQYIYSNSIDTKTPGTKLAIIYVIFKDGSSQKVITNIVVKNLSSGYTPIPQDIRVGLNTIMTNEYAKKHITNTSSLPQDTKYVYATNVDTSTTGTKPVNILVIYGDNSIDTIQSNVIVDSSIVNVDKNIKPIAQDIVVDQGTVLTSEHAKQGIKNANQLPNNTTYRFKDTVDTNVHGNKIAKIIVNYNNTDYEVITTLVVNPINTKYKLEGQNIEVDLNTLLTSEHAKSQIKNNASLPITTTYIYENAVDTSTPGIKPAVILVLYEDGSTSRVVSNIIVRSISSGYTPLTQPITVDLNTTLTNEYAKQHITNKNSLPLNTTYIYENVVDTSTAGVKDVTIIALYSDNSIDKLHSQVIVNAGMNNGSIRPIVQEITVPLNTVLTNVDAKSQIINSSNLLNAVRYEYKHTINTSTVGKKPATIIVTYRDNTQLEVNTYINVIDNGNNNNPTTTNPGNNGNSPVNNNNNNNNNGGQNEIQPLLRDIVVNINDVITNADAKRHISNIDKLPINNIYTYKQIVDTSVEGIKPTILVIENNGKKTEYNVNIIVRQLKDLETYDKTYKLINSNDGTSISRYSGENFFIATDVTRVYTDFMKNLLTQQHNYYLPSILSGSKIGFNINASKKLKLGLFAEYDYNTLNNIGLGTNVYIDLDTVKLNQIVRYRLVIKDDLLQHNIDSYSRFSLLYNENIYARFSAGLYASYSFDGQIDKLVRISDKYLLKGDAAVRLGYNWNDKKSLLYLEAKADYRYDSKQSIYELNSNNIKLYNPTKKFNITGEVGFEQQVNNMKFLESVSFGLDGKLNLKFGIGYNPK